MAVNESAWLGPLGSLVEVPCVGLSESTFERASTELVTLGGVKTVLVSPRSVRSWSLPVASSSPGARAGLGQLVEVIRSVPRRCRLVLPWAALTNLLTPSQSEVQPEYYIAAKSNTLARDVPMVLDTGESVLGLQQSDPTQHVALCAGPAYPLYPPAIPGEPVTVSAWVTGPVGARVILRFLDQNGAGLTGTGAVVASSRAPADPGGVLPLTRVSVTGIAPAAAHCVRMDVSEASKWTRPAVTWSSQVRPWMSGEGAGYVYVPEPTRTALALSSSLCAATAAEFTLAISEVGYA